MANPIAYGSARMTPGIVRMRSIQRTGISLGKINIVHVSMSNPDLSIALVNEQRSFADQTKIESTLDIHQNEGEHNAHKRRAKLAEVGEEHLGSDRPHER